MTRYTQIMKGRQGDYMAESPTGEWVKAADVEAVEAELNAWKAGQMADASGHLFRCAKINGKWSCSKGCAMDALAALLAWRKEQG